MPDLQFDIISAKVKPYSAVPTLSFLLKITNAGADEEVYAAALKCQVLIEATKRQYDSTSKQNLKEVFGESNRWEETVKGLHWTTLTIPVPRFTGETVIEFVIGCYEDHIAAAGKYFYSIRDGEIPLAFLFSGTLFYQDEHQQLQITQVPWHKEALYRMPAVLWHEMMEIYFPHLKWMRINRDQFDKIYQLKIEKGIPTLEKCLEMIIECGLEKVSLKEERVI